MLRRCFPWLCRRVHENESSDSADRKNGAGGGHPHFVTKVKYLSGNFLHVNSSLIPLLNICILNKEGKYLLEKVLKLSGIITYLPTSVARASTL